MKKFMLILIVGICLMVPNYGNAIDVEKFILDANTEVTDLNGLKTDIQDLEGEALDVRLKVSLIDIGAGRIGVDIKPNYGFDSHIVFGTVGAYLRVGFFELYADHGLSGDVRNSIDEVNDGGNKVGVRLIFVDK